VEVLRAAGGVHQFMHWQKPMLTDSGGFQVWSLGQGGDASLVNIEDEGVAFRSHLDGSSRYLTPEESIRIQQAIGADILMCFDEAMPNALGLAEAQWSWQRTKRWAERCVTAWDARGRVSEYGTYQALFGIFQGAMHRELRQKAALDICSLPVDGIAFGGETIGYNMAGTLEVMEWVRDLLPVEKPRYAMGLGRDPQDIIDAALAGFDMFDCVGPTRLARNGAVYQGRVELIGGVPRFVSEFSKGRLSIGAARYELDQSVLNPGCNCATCRAGYSRSYLHHLYRAKELSYYRLASVHNLWTMVTMSKKVRDWIRTGNVEL
jgi:queuine tRNA-ribosyltransferase